MAISRRFTAPLYFYLSFVATAFISTGADAALVGAVAGQHNVGNDGSAQYSIPVNVPAGIQGMQPSIALNYNSNTGNSIGGMGVDISGLSTISRCETTIYHNGFRDGVDFDDSDQYCLDGQRLVAIDGVYGADETEYRLQNDSITKIVSYGNEGTLMQDPSDPSNTNSDAKNPESFEVRTQDGRIYYYGLSTDAKTTTQQEFKDCPAGYTYIEGQYDYCFNPSTSQFSPATTVYEGRTHSWAVSKVVDRYSNKMVYTYTDSIENGNDLEQNISSITYNYRNGEFQNKVDFIYESQDRQDVSSGFYAGAPFRYTNRLKEIRTITKPVGGSEKVLRKLVLNYNYNTNVTGHSRLSTVYECPGNVTTNYSSLCLKPTTFGWSNDQQPGFSTSGGTSTGNSGAGWDKHPKVMDVNGDGRDDVVQARDGYWRIMYSNGSTLQSEVTSLSFNNPGETEVLDYDGDGNADLLMPDSGYWRVLKGGASGFTLENTSIPTQNADTAKLIDVDGDGRKDLMFKANGVIHVRMLSDSGFSTNAIATNANPNDGDGSTWVLDFNGDGKDDILKKFSGYYSVYLSTGNVNGQLFRIINGTNGADGFSSLKILDFNGDGLPDLLLKYNSSVWVRLNVGGDLTAPINLNNNSIGSTAWNNAIPFDYNADGKTDLLFRKNSTWWALISEYGPDAYGNYEPSVSEVDTGLANDGWDKNPLAADIKGNGITDLVAKADSNWHVFPHNTDRPDYVEKITNGMGVETKFHYRFLTDTSDPDFYEPSTGASFPVIDIVNARYLVSKVEQSNGLSGWNSTSYQYRGEKVHAQGLGSLGFSQFIALNNDTDIETKMYFEQDPATYQVGSVTSIYTTNTLNDETISYTFNSWDTEKLCGSTDSLCSGSPEFVDDSTMRVVTGMDFTTTYKYDLNGDPLHKEILNSPTPYEMYYQIGGSDPELVSEVYPAGGGSVLRTKTTKMRYQSNTTLWLMGLLTYSSVESSVPGTSGTSSLTRTTEFDYDSITGKKLEERIMSAPTGGTAIHTTKFGMDGATSAVDSFGRNLAITVSGPDFATRTTHVTYDNSERYIETETNALGQTTSHTYWSDSYLQAGLRKSTTDPNGLVTEYSYDNIGRLTTTTVLSGSSREVETTKSYHWCSESGSQCPTLAQGDGEYFIKTVSDDGSQSRVMIDDLGRTVRKAVLGFDGNWDFTDYLFNVNGHNYAVSEPYNAGSQPQWNILVYDALGRVVEKTNAEARVDTVDFNGLSVTTCIDIQGKNQCSTKTKDPLGNLVSVEDNNSVTVTYDYDALGNMTKVYSPTGDETTITYNILGHKESMDDPDKGEWHYTYNALGQLITQQSPKQHSVGRTTCIAYDLLGRKVKRIDDYQGDVTNTIGSSSQSKSQCSNDSTNPTTSWVYDTANGKGIGSLHSVSGPAGYVKSFTYNSFGQIDKVSETINGTPYTITTDYDSLNRVYEVTYPGPGNNHLTVKHTYNPRGYLQFLKNASNNDVYYEVQKMGPRGNVTKEVHGDDVLITQRGYDPESGNLIRIETGTSILTPADRQELDFDFDLIGNLETRVDILKDFSETFDYDTLNRLTDTYADFGNGQTQTTTIEYDALGRITSKTGVGSYSYGTCGTLHGVCSISGQKNASYGYDANGNMDDRAGDTILWSSFDKPTKISKGSNYTEMAYGPDRELITRSDRVGNADTDTVLVGGIYEKVTLPNSDTKERHYIGANTVVTITNRTLSVPGTSETNYLLKDHIGSTTVITDDQGVEIERFSFDAWGKRRAPTLADLESILGSWGTLDQFQKGNLTISALQLDSSTTNRGFTGHEQLDTVNLVHMGGRVYDPEIGRFLSADPFVQDRMNLQSLNRYSYVWNNPLSYTDPSGYLLSDLKKSIKAFVKAHTELYKAYPWCI